MIDEYREYACWQTAEYEGFEVHVAPFPQDPPTVPPDAKPLRYTYIGYVCHPGADPAIPGHAVPFHPDGDVSFASAADALFEGVHVGRSIVDGTHPDLSVLALVTSGV
ncbi:hypothetical protein BWP39_10705 [Paraburkholderia acidicola]|uniref:Uncharacterized protein n=1 Tax=Paraburkholderia acidicola TaxID=1912599 RepID=A0A2A4EXW2_9BURK|nr:hypothetical protein [Paraburkholderia acidicola]PCE24986.1 hypothetical protein BWP39_10705 [Paraburkholderia acidicola]